MRRFGMLGLVGRADRQNPRIDGWWVVPARVAAIAIDELWEIFWAVYIRQHCRHVATSPSSAKFVPNTMPFGPRFSRHFDFKSLIDGADIAIARFDLLGEWTKVEGRLEDSETRGEGRVVA